MPILLDTVALSELRKKSKADTSVIAWQKAESGAPAFISIITMNEIRYSARMVAPHDPGFAARLEAWYLEILAAKTLYSILPIDLPIAEIAADFRAGFELSYNDSLIAATAKVHRLTLATCNITDFQQTGIDLLNPWDFKA